MHFPFKRQRTTGPERTRPLAQGEDASMEFRSSKKDQDISLSSSSTDERPRLEVRNEPSLELDDVRAKHLAKRNQEKAHQRQRFLYRRQEAPSVSVVTVVEDAFRIVEAAVDANGNTQLTTLPSVPTVPAVPPFPVDLTVPAEPTPSPVVMPQVPGVPSFPFTSEAVVAAAAVSSSVAAAPQTSSSARTPSPAPAPAGVSVAPADVSSQVVLSQPTTPTSPTGPLSVANSLPAPVVSAGNSTVTDIATQTTAQPKAIIPSSGTILLPGTTGGNATTSAARPSSPRVSGATLSGSVPATSSRNLTTSTIVFSANSTRYTTTLVIEQSTSVTALPFYWDATTTLFATGVSIVDPSSIDDAPATATDPAAGGETGSVTGVPAGATGAGVPAGITTGQSSTATSAASGGSRDTGNGTPLPTPQLVGSVVGSIAGFAFILLLLLILLRVWKRRSRTVNGLPLNGNDSERYIAAPPTASSRGLTSNPATSRSSLFGAAVPPHLFNRLQGLSRSREEMREASTASTGERSFQRMSGRKLPSAFSDGVEGPTSSKGGQDPRAGALSGQSFYRDSAGFYGGAGAVASEASNSPQSKRQQAHASSATNLSNLRASSMYSYDNLPGSTAQEKEMMMPGPARTPVVHQGGPYTPLMSQGEGPTPPRSPTFLRPDSAPLSRDGVGRSHGDGSRNSKFTEDFV